MIRIHIVQNKQVLKKIILEGHANYNEYGKDIVCAAVSATYLCTINGIFALNGETIKVEDNNDKKIIKVLNYDKTTITLLENMIRCLTSLEKQYPKNIKLDKEEE